MSGGKFPTAGIFARGSLVKRPAAVWITPPPVPVGRPGCPCCLGPVEAGLCVPCQEARMGRLADPTIVTIGRVKGSWARVRFARRHTRCPLSRLDHDGSGGGEWEGGG